MQCKETGRMQKYLHEVRQIVQRYRATFPQDDEFLRFLPQQLEKGDTHICHRKNFSGHLTASALVLNTDERTALLIHHRFLKRWLQPGGHLDNKEAPADGALRELVEETGWLPQWVKLHQWHADTGIPLDIDSHLIPNNSSKLEFSHYHHDFLYLFSNDSGPQCFESSDQKTVLQDEEVAGCKWAELSDITAGMYGQRLARAIKKYRVINGQTKP